MTHTYWMPANQSEVSYWSRNLLT